MTDPTIAKIRDLLAAAIEAERSSPVPPIRYPRDAATVTDLADVIANRDFDTLEEIARFVPGVGVVVAGLSSSEIRTFAAVAMAADRAMAARTLHSIADKVFAASRPDTAPRSSPGSP